MGKLKFDVFGRLVLIVQTQESWSVFYVSKDGRSRQAEDIVIPTIVGAFDLEL